MSMNAQAIEGLLTREGSGRTPEEHDDAPESADAQAHRTQLLADVLSSCKEAHSSGSDDLKEIAEKLGDGSRDVAWRIPYGESGILEFFLGLLENSDTSQDVRVHALRIVGNSCADTDENRARMLEGQRFMCIVNQLKRTDLIRFAIPVLYNAMVDYEPIQRLASQSYLSHHLMALISSPNLPVNITMVPYMCKILALLIAQDGESALADPLTPHILFTLALRAPARDDVDDFTAISSVAVAYLASEQILSKLVGSESDIVLFLEDYYHAHAHFDLQKVDDEDTAAQLKQLRSSMLSTLADISANDTFRKYQSVHSSVAHSLLKWLQQPNILLQSAACLTLGNLSRSDAASGALVKEHKAHVPLLQTLSDPAISDPQLLHAAMSFLKNLAIPAENKLLLSGFLDASAVPRILSMDTLPQIQFSAVSLIRLLLLNCASNVKKVCEPLSVEGSRVDLERTTLNGIISLFGRSDAEPIRLEAARCVASVCRTIHSSPVNEILSGWAVIKANDDDDEDEDSLRRMSLYKKHDPTQALAFLITQPKWPVLRAEGWFVLALICRSRDGAANVLKTLDIPETMAVLDETVTGRQSGSEDQTSSKALTGSTEATDVDEDLAASLGGLQLEPKQADPRQMASMAKVNRENAVVLCTELVRRWADDTPKEKLAIFEKLAKEGSQLVVTDRAAKS